MGPKTQFDPSHNRIYLIIDHMQRLDRGRPILFFARIEKRQESETVPFIFLGPVQDLVSYEGNRPIAMIWQLQYPVPAELFELAKAV